MDRIRSVVRAIEADDEAMVERVLQLSRAHRALAPLALTTGAFAMLFHGLKLLVSNWRLILIQALPAMWIWLAMADLKVHVLHGNSFRVLRGPVLIPIVLAIVVVTAAAFFLNTVFAFAIARSPIPTSGSPSPTRGGSWLRSSWSARWSACSWRCRRRS